MEQYLEFVTNHPMLIGAFAVTLGMIVFVELQRRMRGGKEINPSAAVRLQNDDGLFIDVRDLAEACVRALEASVDRFECIDFTTWRAWVMMTAAGLCPVDDTGVYTLARRL